MRVGKGFAGTTLLAFVGVGAVFQGWTSFPAPQHHVTYVHDALDRWEASAGHQDDCKQAVIQARSGLDQMGSWTYTDQPLYDDDNKRVPAYTTPDPNAPGYQEWVDEGMPDDLYPAAGSGTETTVNFTYPDLAMSWRGQLARANDRLAFVVAHEALHWLEEHGIHHTHEDFQGLENCIGGV